MAWQQASMSKLYRFGLKGTGGNATLIYLTGDYSVPVSIRTQMRSITASSLLPSGS